MAPTDVTPAGQAATETPIRPAIAAPVLAWQATRPALSGSLGRDRDLFGQFWRQGATLLDALPAKARRDTAEAATAAAIFATARSARIQFMAAHHRQVYDSLTGNMSRFVHLDELLSDAATLVPGLMPDRTVLEREKELAQRDKDGHEIDQGLFLNHVLADPDCGMHLCHTMLLPRPASLKLLPKFMREGHVTLDGASAERRGKSTVAVMSNRRFLNAEDDSTLAAAEIAVDLCLLDPESQICILRGDRIEHPKYASQRIFGSGINLTRLYQGQIPLLWYLKRDMGFVNKIYRGLARPDISPDEVTGETTEKPWVAQLDGFAIGGSCQILLACDYIVAADNAYMTLPARKEGIIPGLANMRLWRFTGDRIARQAIQSERRIDCDSPEGRQICDEIVPVMATEDATEALVDRFLNSGGFSAAANRRAIRIAQEPLDLFRRYIAYYAKAEAECHFSPQLIANLERFWGAQNRKI
ncbi:MAG: enoyl-CoA hydratase/isomerase family protein [Xanthobacteraceae bacterium]|nr:MAG: enoyl-CoA hydratase/isomerase family protein [Xanthobacteraceae bacterium]